MYPYSNPSIISKGLGLLKTIKWGEFLDGTQKTLNVINQAIPIVYQVKPIIGNAKTLFKIADIIRSPQEENTSSYNDTKKEDNSSNNSPIFYI